MLLPVQPKMEVYFMFGLTPEQIFNIVPYLDHEIFKLQFSKPEVKVSARDQCFDFAFIMLGITFYHNLNVLP